MVDIEINAWSSLFLNIENNVILYLYPDKCIQFNQSELRIRIRKILKFFAQFKINAQKQEVLTNLKKKFDFFVLYPKKSGLSKKLKVSTLDIRIKQSGLKVSHKFPALIPFNDKNAFASDCLSNDWDVFYFNVNSNKILISFSKMYFLLKNLKKWN